MNNKLYLGDSVYATYDGFGILLTTENGFPDDPRNSIYFEPRVIAAFNLFIEAIKEGKVT